MSTCPITIDKGQTLIAAHASMRVHSIRHSPVLKPGSLVGIVSQCDLYVLDTLRDVDLKPVTVEAMTIAPSKVSPDAPLAEVARHMAFHRLGSAVVVDAQGRLVGLFTTTDALTVLADMVDGS